MWMLSGFLWQISKMKLFAKIVNGIQSLTIFAESSILDIWSRILENIEVNVNIDKKWVNQRYTMAEK